MMKVCRARPSVQLSQDADKALQGGTDTSIPPCYAFVTVKRVQSGPTPRGSRTHCTSHDKIVGCVSSRFSRFFGRAEGETRESVPFTPERSKVRSLVGQAIAALVPTAPQGIVIAAGAASATVRSEAVADFFMSAEWGRRQASISTHRYSDGRE